MDSHADGSATHDSHTSSPRTRTPAAVGVLGLFVLALGCATPPPTPSATWSPSDELVQVDTGGRGLLLIRPDHQLGRYDDLLIERLGFRYGRGQRPLSDREERRIGEILEHVVHGTQNGEVGLATEPGPCVLSVHLYLTELELYDLDFGIGATTSIVNSFGEATLVMELRDSLSDLPLARFLQRRNLGGGTGSGGTDDSLRRLGTVVGLAMHDMGEQLQRMMPPTTGDWDAHCDGGMARVALGAH